MNLDKFENLPSFESGSYRRIEAMIYRSHNRTCGEAYTFLRNKLKGWIGKSWSKAYSALVKDKELLNFKEVFADHDIHTAIKDHVEISSVKVDDNGKLYLENNRQWRNYGYENYWIENQHHSFYYVNPKTGILHYHKRVPRNYNKEYISQSKTAKIKFNAEIHAAKGYEKIPGLGDRSFADVEYYYFIGNKYLMFKFLHGIWYKIEWNKEDHKIVDNNANTQPLWRRRRYKSSLSGFESISVITGYTEPTLDWPKGIPKYKNYSPVTKQLSSKELKDYGLQNAPQNY